jgi:hypothetical protein
VDIKKKKSGEKEPDPLRASTNFTQAEKQADNEGRKSLNNQLAR